MQFIINSCDLPPKVHPQLSEKVYKTSIFIRIVIHLSVAVRQAIVESILHK